MIDVQCIVIDKQDGDAGLECLWTFAYTLKKISNIYFILWDNSALNCLSAI